jgi:hypothetical protein
VRTLAEAGSSLVIQSPLWLPLALMAAGLVLMALPLFLKPPRPYRLGALLGTVLFLVAGWQLFTTTTTFEARGFHVTGRFGEEERVGWLQVTGIDPRPTHLLVQLRNGGEVEVDLSGLSEAEKARVVGFARERLKR